MTTPAPVTNPPSAARSSPSIDRAMASVRGLRLLGKVAGLGWAMPYLLMYWGGCFTMGRDRAFRGSSERIGALTGQLGVYARQWFYRVTLREVGDDVYFGFMSMFSRADIRIADRVYIGRFCSVGLADLEEEAVLADGVQVLSGRHAHASAGGLRAHGEVRFERVTIGRRAWLGANAVVMADVGESAIVGAGAVITKPVGAEARAVGVPPKPLTAIFATPAAQAA